MDAVFATFVPPDDAEYHPLNEYDVVLVLLSVLVDEIDAPLALVPAEKPETERVSLVFGHEGTVIAAQVVAPYVAVVLVEPEQLLLTLFKVTV